MLTASPEIAYSKVKEPHFFLECDSEDPEMLADYGSLFVDRPGAKFRMEATAIYFYGVPRVPAIISNNIPDARIIVIFREPHDRLVSEFKYLKTRLLLPAKLGLEEYVEKCMSLPDEDWRKRENRHLLGVRNGYYDRYFPEWVERFGSQIKVLFHDDLVADPVRVVQGVIAWLDLPSVALNGGVAVHNKGVSFRVASLQRHAVDINDRLEPFFRRNPRLKVLLRGAYYRINGARAESAPQLSVDHPLSRAYLESKQVFRTQLQEWDPSLVLPDWLVS